jgi:endonuclease/exonuclease/phosphatase family metal-dependent hydrolase
VATVASSGSAPSQSASTAATHPQQRAIRFATFNASLNRNAAGALVADLAQPLAAAPTPTRQQAANVAEVIQRVRPDVLLVNEFDYDAGHDALRLFARNYLGVGQNGAAAIHYRYAFTAPSNTGVPSGHDLDNNGSVGGPNDAYGFGLFPGQYGMAVYSRYPIDYAAVRTFQTFRWADMPGARLPDDPATAAPRDWYSPAELADVRLSSKSHWDVPIRVGRRTVHFLVSHPTPPVFDGPEDRNGLRNADEIRFWADYISPRRSRYIYDDEGRRGGLRPRAHFVIAGDLNSDPYDGDSVPGAAQQLLLHPRVNTACTPASAGGATEAALQGGANLTHRGNPAYDTADFADSTPGNLRVDYVLPDRRLRVRGCGVFWPTRQSALFRLTGVFDPSLPGGFPTSDHRLVWLDIAKRRGWGLG